jgi:hypothetical protein
LVEVTDVRIGPADVHQKTHTSKAGLNYRFNIGGSSAVYARY